jgi:hypothetical protein
MLKGLAITCVSRLLPLIGTGRLSAKTKPPLSGRQINHRLGLSPEEGSMSSPRAGTALRPELARSGLLNSMTGKVFQEDRRR